MPVLSGKNYEGKGNSPDPFKKVQAANRAAIIQ